MHRGCRATRNGLHTENGAQVLREGAPWQLFDTDGGAQDNGTGCKALCETFPLNTGGFSGV